MHPLQQTFTSKFTQIATDRVLRDAQFLTERLGYQTAITA